MQKRLLTLLASLFFCPSTWAQSSAMRFSHRLETTASPERIWAIWTDVSNWNQWDDGLRASSVDGPFEAGARGQLQPDRGPKSRFRIIEMEANRSYLFRTRLPLGSLDVRRKLEPSESGGTIFVHEVRFRGLSGWIFARVLGKKYRAILPVVMEKIKILAEQ